MHIRPTIVAAALLMGTTVLTGAATAADVVQGANGTVDTTTSRAGPWVPPGPVSPTPTPKLDASTLSRGAIGMTVDQAAASYGSVTVSYADGSTSTEPASGAVRASLTSAVKGASVPLKAGTVLGGDNRTQITDSLNVPDAVIGWFWNKDKDGNWHSCTATLIGAQTVLTAAHCVYDLASHSFGTAAQFIPGVTDGKTPPFGVFDVSAATVLNGFIDNYDGHNYGSSMPWDVAVVQLQQDAGHAISKDGVWLGFEVDDASDFHATMVGYPADKPNGTMWQVSCDIPAANFGDTAFKHDCDSAPGSSGSAMWLISPDHYVFIRGINVAEDDTANYGVRITQPTFQWIIEHDPSAQQ